eukprot:Blabericola_migrator_1__599@NODE_1147_length_5278_cov_121_056227_g781_i0_p2_GENE_NODE_1147_length_5278_cov_121_056227_g781_i0NODE_1147_length_5278_cov_121_056227_g781_i0_p2_ORF_typecomplete_len180_score21_20CholecysARec_N/PF09193_10/0_077_NODE_1147_length_5278_cov_121_056227_g781_i0405944
MNTHLIPLTDDESERSSPRRRNQLRLEAMLNDNCVANNTPAAAPKNTLWTAWAPRATNDNMIIPGYADDEATVMCDFGDQNQTFFCTPLNGSPYVEEPIALPQTNARWAGSWLFTSCSPSAEASEAVRTTREVRNLKLRESDIPKDLPSSARTTASSTSPPLPRKKKVMRLGGRSDNYS